MKNNNIIKKELKKKSILIKYKMPNIESYYIFGEEQEKKIKSILINYFNQNLQEQDRYSKYDFVGENINIELKSRQNKKIDSFKTTLLACNKINTDENKDLYFVFNFVFDVSNDKKQIYCIKYDKELFDTFDLEDIQYADRSYKLHYHIPIDKLTKIYEDECNVIPLSKCKLLNKIKK